MPKKPDLASPPRRWFLLLCSVLASLLLAPAARLHAAAQLVDERQCQGCHAGQVEHWTGSHHQLAMQAANDASVLGDFNDITVRGERETTRFFKRDGGFWVNTTGRDGKPGDFPVAYAFGVEPLQQYLIDTGAGHLQALGVAWDTRQRKWFHLYPGQGVDFKNPLHWSSPQQNANFMCMECHTCLLYTSDAADE